MLRGKKIGFLGGGNMAEAMIKGLLSASFIESKNIISSDLSDERLQILKDKYSIHVSQDNRDMAKNSDIIIIAVKPQAIKNVLSEIYDLINENKLIISVAAGVSIKSLESYLNLDGHSKVNVIRSMPNTPALVQAGVTALASGHNVSKSNLKIGHRIFEAIGKTVDVDETHLDAVTGLSGSGPAYIFTIIEALSDAGVKMGLSREVANILTIQTVLGSAKLALETGKHPGELKDMVTSPGGTTISGLHTIEKGGLRTTLINAVEEATKRSIMLGKGTIGS